MVTTNFSVLGKPLHRQLTVDEIDMFNTAQVTLPDDSAATVYYKLQLNGTGRILRSTATSRSRLRDNSGLVYTTSDGNCYGKFQIAILFDAHSFAVITPLYPSGEDLCKDSMTGARLNNHIVSLLSPRYVNNMYFSIIIVFL